MKNLAQNTSKVNMPDNSLDAPFVFISQQQFDVAFEAWSIANIDPDYSIPAPVFKQPSLTKLQKEELSMQKPEDEDRYFGFGDCHRCGAIITRKPRRYDHDEISGLCGRCASLSIYGIRAQVLEEQEVSETDLSTGLLRHSSLYAGSLSATLSTQPTFLLNGKSAYNVKKVTAGSHEEVRFYDHPVLGGFELDEDAKKRRAAAAKETRERNKILREDCQEIIKKRFENVQRSKYTLSGLVNANFVKDRTWFPVFTYDDEHYFDYEGKEIDIPTAKEHFRQFVRRYNDKHPGHSLQYVAVIERGGRYKRYHFHAVFFNMEGLDKKELEKLWGKGFVSPGRRKVTKLTKEGNVGKYLAKYMGKGCTEEAYTGKLYLNSQGLKRPIEETGLFPTVQDAKKAFRYVPMKHTYYRATWQNKWVGTTSILVFDLQINLTNYQKRREYCRKKFARKKQLQNAIDTIAQAAGGLVNSGEFVNVCSYAPDFITDLVGIG